MSDNRREALEALRDKVKAGDDAGFRKANRAAFSTPCQDMALQLREEHCRHAYKGSLDAAFALHDAVLPNMMVRSIIQRGRGRWEATLWPDTGTVNMDNMVSASNGCRARALLLADIEALIS